MDIGEMRYFMLGGWTTKTKVYFDITIENYKIFVNNFFWNFDISEKSQLISAVCLHFSQKTKISKILRLQTEN